MKGVGRRDGILKTVRAISVVCCWLRSVDLEALLTRHTVSTVVLCDSLDQCRGQVEVLALLSKNLV